MVDDPQAMQTIMQVRVYIYIYVHMHNVYTTLTNPLFSPPLLPLQLYAACPGGGTGDNRLQVCFFSATLHR